MDIKSLTKNLWFSLNHPLISPTKSSVLGLDIGNFNIKSVEITRLKDKIELSGHIIERIQDGNTLSAIVRIAENFRNTKKVTGFLSLKLLRLRKKLISDKKEFPAKTT